MGINTAKTYQKIDILFCSNDLKISSSILILYNNCNDSFLLNSINSDLYYIATNYTWAIIRVKQIADLLIFAR